MTAQAPLQGLIVDALAAGNMTVTELAEVCECSKQQIERALGVLWMRRYINWKYLKTEVQLTAEGQEIAEIRAALLKEAGT